MQGRLTHCIVHVLEVVVAFISNLIETPKLRNILFQWKDFRKQDTKYIGTGKARRFVYNIGPRFKDFTYV